MSARTHFKPDTTTACNVENGKNRQPDRIPTTTVTGDVTCRRCRTTEVFKAAV